MAKSIPLSQGMITLVDDEDYADLSRWKWTYTAHRTGYAVRGDYVHGNRKTVYMHRIITKAQIGDEVDHINHDTLDNQRSNLRRASRSENARNQSKRRSYRGVPTVSQYKGVTWAHGRWIATITVKRKQTHIGAFADEMQAARAYDAAARQHFGSFAATNFQHEKDTAR